jgi:hypothetical protein
VYEGAYDVIEDAEEKFRMNCLLKVFDGAVSYK